MNLISCDGCGVVLDKPKLLFHEDIYMDSGEVDTSKASWNGDKWVSYTRCPVCGSEVLED